MHSTGRGGVAGIARTNRAIWLAVLCITVGPSAVAQESKIAPEKKAAMESAIARIMAANHIPGVSVAVVENGEYEWSAGFGMSDLENFVPATAQTLYRLASISKPITATAALLLWQQGKLDLDAPVQKYCPGFPTKDAPITTRQVLGHLAGVRHYKNPSQEDPEVGNVKHFSDPVAGGLQFFKDDPLVSVPGASFHYSTQGFTVAGCVIEGASGQKYVDYVGENVLRPAAMTQTRVDDRFAVIPLRTRFYQKDKSGGIVNADFLDSSYKIPGGGWLSSADDLARFEIAMLKNQIVERKTRDLMWTPLKTGDGRDNAYALGWGTGKDLGVTDVGHGGGQQGTSTFIMLVPERQAGVVVLMNLEGGDASSLASDLMRIVLAIAPTPAK